MDYVPTVGQDEAAVKELMAQYDAPAYVRRARGVEAAYQQLLDHCGRQREELLGMVRTRLGLLHALAGAWAALRPLLADDAQVSDLRALAADLNPRLRVPVEPTTSRRTLRQALHELCESVERFNRRWQEFLDQVELGALNRLREAYNRYYPLEKECAVRSWRLARHGFQPLAPLTHADLAARFPLLPVPRPATEV